MAEDAKRSNRRRRGVARASPTRLEAKVAEMESEHDRTSATHSSAQRLQKCLKEITADFKTYHLALVDLVEEGELEAEQATLDEHEDKTLRLASRLRQIISECEAGTYTTDQSTPNQHLSKRLRHIEQNLSLVVSAVDSTASGPDVDTCLLHQYESQLSDLKTELTCVSRDILALDTDDDSLSKLESELRKCHFDVCLKIRRSLQGQVKDPTLTDDKGGVKLPRLDVPTFDGNFVNWRSFWEQYSVSVHSRKQLASSEKLAYLKHALKGGSAKHVVEGLSGSGNNYDEAIDCLQKRYDRPRLIHQAHVRAILDAPALKEGNGKELRRLHDTVTQHLRALKAMDCEPSGPFITSALELKLDDNTMFEWQKYSQDSPTVPHFSSLLQFLNLRAQATESWKSRPTSRQVPSFATTVTTVSDTCPVCKASTLHPLYSCSRFKTLPHEQMTSVVRENGFCMNCLRPGHFARQCTSTQKCRRCQRPHHTLLHLEVKTPKPPTHPAPLQGTTQNSGDHSTTILSHVAPSGSQSPQMLLMTSRVLVTKVHCVTAQARALLDSASSTSFISEHLAQHLRLPRSRRLAQIAGIGGMSDRSSTQAVVQFQISPLWSTDKIFEVEAVVLPKVTCDLPLHPVALDQKWHHLSGIRLADPDFDTPGKIDILLGVDIFSNVLLHGRRFGPTGSPTALETSLGWVLAGSICNSPRKTQIVVHHSTVLCADDLLRRFWELEETFTPSPARSPEEKSVMSHFHDAHRRDETGRFIVPLPKKPDAEPLGESRSQAVRRFLSLERSLRMKGQFQEFSDVMEEYLELNHAEVVPVADLERPREEVFYLPMHAVIKQSSSTTKIRAVFDASAKSSTGVSLNDQLLVGPTVHSPLVDVLLRFRLHRVALTTDVSKMYRAVLLPSDDWDLHRFVWRKRLDEPLRDYRMTRLTFGVSSSSFAANMSVKQNAIDFTQEFPLAASAVHESFYVDDGLVGADSTEEATQLQQQLQDLFTRGGFLLRKWKSSDPESLRHVPLTSWILFPLALSLILMTSPRRSVSSGAQGWTVSAYL